jgi:pilus assembly protein CpaC
MRVRPEVSELSSQGAVTINGFQIPALTTRRAETTIELGSGQSFMIAGLMNHNAQTTIDKAPGLGDMPIIGNLFRSRSFRKGETELVIVVTPYLVKPVNDRDIRLPTDGFNAATELQQLFGYRNNAGNGGERPNPQPGNGDGTPSVGGVTPDAVAPRRAGDDNNKDRNAAVATPGFNL